MDAENYLKDMIVAIRRRAVESDAEADFEFDRALALGDESIGLDSMDLAEVVARIQKDYGITLFEDGYEVRTWGDVIDVLDRQKHAS
jgi:acyl carrier protein